LSLARAHRLVPRASLAGAFLLLAPIASAAPQWNASLIPGAGLQRENSSFDQVVFWGAARGDLLLLRERASDIGLGPYLMLATAAFGDLRASAGASLLLPTNEDFPLVFSAGAFTRDGRAFGLDSSMFWGLRSYNFHGTYNLAGGVVLGAQHSLGSASETVLTLGVQVDAFVLLIPILLLRGALGGG
jgi:hypothetical protein